MTRKILIDLGDFKYKWVEVEPASSFAGSTREMHHSGKDPTVDQYISDKGAIFNHADNKYSLLFSYLKWLKLAVWFLNWSKLARTGQMTTEGNQSS
jgi:hypothetical protein